VVQWCSGAVVQWCSGAVVQWCSGEVVKWCEGAVTWGRINLKMIGKTIIGLERVDSTNTYADNILQKSDLEEGTVVWAFEQFAGKGLNENKWESEAGKNLTFSIILHPDFLSADMQFRLNKAISLGITDYINSLIHGTSIKWPNDIYSGNRKIAGILIENKIIGSLIRTSIVGIGININQINFDPGIPNPVSLIQVLKREMVLKEELDAVCRFLDYRYIQLRNGDHNIIDHDYHRWLAGSDEWRQFDKRGERMEGKIEGVDDFGRLLITTREGKKLSFNHKEIEYLFPDKI